MSIEYNVATLLKEPVGSTREYEVDDRVLIDDDQPHHRHVVGRTTLLRIKTGVLASVTLDGVEDDRCSRCLRPVDVPLHVEFSEEYHARFDLETGAALPKPDDPEAFRIDARNVIDIQEAVRQYWTAGRPMQALCRPDCRGLCPRCGRDLNLRPCECEPEPDERWAALRALAPEATKE
jgi:uncharacterized protein